MRRRWRLSSSWRPRSAPRRRGGKAAINHSAINQEDSFMPFRRREFVTTAAAAGAHLLGASRARAAVNDRIRVAIIGLGGRGRDHMRDCDKISGVEVAAFCEPDETRMAQRAREFE